MRASLHQEREIHLFLYESDEFGDNLALANIKMRTQKILNYQRYQERPDRNIAAVGKFPLTLYDAVNFRIFIGMN